MKTHLLQHAAAHCNTLQHTATHSTTLQHTNEMYLIPFSTSLFFLEFFEKRRTFLYQLFQKRLIFCILEDTLKFYKEPKIQTYSTPSWVSLFLISESFFISGMCCQEAGQGDLNVLKEMWKRVVVMTSIDKSNCNTHQRTATHCNTLQHIATHCNTGASRNERIKKDLWRSSDRVQRHL